MVFHRIRLWVKGSGVRDGVGVVYHRIRLRVKGPGAEESAPYACVSIRRDDWAAMAFQARDGFAAMYLRTWSRAAVLRIMRS